MNKTDDTNAAVRGSECNAELGLLVDEEMAAYYEGEYMDHSVVKCRLQDFAQAVQAAERERWKERAIAACNSAGDGPDNGCCPTYWEEAREACIAAIQKA